MKITLDNAAHYTWGEACDGWHLLKSDSLNVIREQMPANTSEQVHYHQKATQLFYILSGSATIEINGTTHTLHPHESIVVEPRALHRICNHGPGELDFLLTSQPRAQNDRIDLVTYTTSTKDAIRLLNYEWLEKYFKLEPGDIDSLNHPQERILDRGGEIFYAKWKDEIVGTASLLRESNTLFELGKMAVTEKAQGHHIGNALIEQCFHEARKKGIQRLVLYSNTSLAPAIHLYKKYGFVEVTLETGHYERANIKMEKIL